jgi:hypothetical protein
MNALADSTSGLRKFTKALWGVIRAKKALTAADVAGGIMAGTRKPGAIAAAADPVGQRLKGFWGQYKNHLIIGFAAAAIAATVYITGALDKKLKTHQTRVRKEGGFALQMEMRKNEAIIARYGTNPPAAFRNMVADASRFIVEQAVDGMDKLANQMAKMAEHSKALKDNFTIASGMLGAELDKLKDVSKAKTQVIDVRQMRSLMSRLSKGRFQDEGDELTRRGMLAVGKSILGDLRRMRDVGLSPRQHKALAEKISAFGIGAEDISTFHRGIISPRMMKKLRKQLIDPALAAGSVVQARRTEVLERGWHPSGARD